MVLCRSQQSHRQPVPVRLGLLLWMATGLVPRGSFSFVNHHHRRLLHPHPRHHQDTDRTVRAMLMVVLW
uniref:Putative secreted protein n=1 Tax=Anopheles triannulatus TaxID=58253 RepID=A0A2M4B5M5_9DIPT